MKTSQLDLRELLDFNPQGGVLTFMGQRAFLTDPISEANLRNEFVSLLGESVARTVLTRAGYSQGWRIAEALEKDVPEAWAEAKKGGLGPLVHAMSGCGELVYSKRGTGEGDVPLVETRWERSIEAEQYLVLHGQSEKTECWRLEGYASGYVSYLQGRPVYFVEDECQAKGDKFCRLVGRYKESWGEQIEEILSHYGEPAIEKSFGELYPRLRVAEQKLMAQREEVRRHLDEVDETFFPVARSAAMRRVLDLALRVAPTGTSVLICGGSGVGKERFAKLIHNHSPRRDKKLLAINCGAVAESLLDSELFGHAKGAFTGADQARIGLFESCRGGTLFLDEVGELSPQMQVKLLRVLQEKEIRRVGETQSRPVDVRIVAATNRCLQTAIAEGTFREDLYYRLKVVEIDIPPLRERLDDIMPLARTFMSRLATQNQKKITSFNYKAADCLLSYSWPGNVRELENAIEHAVVLCQQAQIHVEDLPPDVRCTITHPATSESVRPIKEIERDYLLSALEAFAGDKSRTARALGISLATLYRKLEKYEGPGKGR